MIVDFLNCRGPVAQELIVETPVRVTQFTGSSRVAELLLNATNGKVKIEDAGFDWKILGPDVGDVDYVAWQCDQDAYASIGQKCSAQSICFKLGRQTSNYFELPCSKSFVQARPHLSQSSP